MNKKQSLPGRSTLIDVLKGVTVPESWQSSSTPEIKELERQVSTLRAELLRNPKLRELEKKVSKLQAARAKKNKELRKRKIDLINRVKLAEVTPQLVADVRRFAGIKS